MLWSEASSLGLIYKQRLQSVTNTACLQGGRSWVSQLLGQLLKSTCPMEQHLFSNGFSSQGGFTKPHRLSLCFCDRFPSSTLLSVPQKTGEQLATFCLQQWVFWLYCISLTIFLVTHCSCSGLMAISHSSEETRIYLATSPQTIADRFIHAEAALQLGMILIASWAIRACPFFPLPPACSPAQPSSFKSSWSYSVMILPGLSGSSLHFVTTTF